MSHTYTQSRTTAQRSRGNHRPRGNNHNRNTGQETEAQTLRSLAENENHNNNGQSGRNLPYFSQENRQRNRSHIQGNLKKTNNNRRENFKRFHPPSNSSSSSETNPRSNFSKKVSQNYGSCLPKMAQNPIFMSELVSRFNSLVPDSDFLKPEVPAEKPCVSNSVQSERPINADSSVFNENTLYRNYVSRNRNKRSNNNESRGNPGNQFKESSMQSVDNNSHSDRINKPKNIERPDLTTSVSANEYGHKNWDSRENKEARYFKSDNFIKINDDVNSEPIKVGGLSSIKNNEMPQSQKEHMTHASTDKPLLPAGNNIVHQPVIHPHINGQTNLNTNNKINLSQTKISPENLKRRIDILKAHGFKGAPLQGRSETNVENTSFQQVTSPIGQTRNFVQPPNSQNSFETRISPPTNVTRKANYANEETFSNFNVGFNNEDVAGGRPFNIQRAAREPHEKVVSRLEALQKAQIEYEVKKAEYEAKQREKEAKKREQYLAKYKHVDQGHRLSEGPYLDEAAGYDPEISQFLEPVEVVRERQQEQLRRDALAHQERQREENEKILKKEEEKKAEWLKKQHVDLGYKLGHGDGTGGVKRKSKHPYNQNVHSTDKMRKEQKTPPPEPSISPELLLEGETYEQFLIRQEEQLILESLLFSQIENQREERKSSSERSEAEQHKRAQTLGQPNNPHNSGQAEKCNTTQNFEPPNQSSRAQSHEQRNIAQNYLQYQQPTTTQTLKQPDPPNKAQNCGQLNKSHNSEQYQQPTTTQTQKQPELPNRAKNFESNKNNLRDSTHTSADVNQGVVGGISSNVEAFFKSVSSQSSRTVKRVTPPVEVPKHSRTVATQTCFSNDEVVVETKANKNQSPSSTDGIPKKTETSDLKETQNTMEQPKETMAKSDLHVLVTRNVQKLQPRLNEKSEPEIIQQPPLSMMAQPPASAVSQSCVLKTNQGAVLVLRPSPEALNRAVRRRLMVQEVIEEMDKRGYSIHYKANIEVAPVYEKPFCEKLVACSEPSKSLDCGVATTSNSSSLTTKNSGPTNQPAVQEERPVIDYMAELRAARMRMQKQYEETVKMNKGS